MQVDSFHRKLEEAQDSLQKLSARLSDDSKKQEVRSQLGPVSAQMLICDAGGMCWQADSRDWIHRAPSPAGYQQGRLALWKVAAQCWPLQRGVTHRAQSHLTVGAPQARLEELSHQQADLSQRLGHLEVSSSGLLTQPSTGVLQQQLRAELRRDVQEVEGRLASEVHACSSSAAEIAAKAAEVRVHCKYSLHRQHHSASALEREACALAVRASADCGACKLCRLGV